MPTSHEAMTKQLQKNIKPKKFRNWYPKYRTLWTEMMNSPHNLSATTTVVPLHLPSRSRNQANHPSQTLNFNISTFRSLDKAKDRTIFYLFRSNIV